MCVLNRKRTGVPEVGWVGFKRQIWIFPSCRILIIVLTRLCFGRSLGWSNLPYQRVSFFFLSFRGLVFFLFWLCGGISWGCSFSVLGILFYDFPFDFFLEDIRMTCLLMLLCCGGIALFYCFHYFGGSSDSFLLYPLMVWFLGVMCFLVLRGCFLFSLVL